MRSNKRFAHGVGKRTGVLLVVATTLAFAACSKKDNAAPPIIVNHEPTAKTVVSVGWGASLGELGRNVQEEGLPEGPKTFAVDAGGVIHVLDQENGRIQKFAGGKVIGTADLPPRPFDDIEIAAKGYALLDVHSSPAIVFVDEAGLPKSEVALESDEIPEPSLVTALVRATDGYYVEVSDDYLVRVTDANEAAVEPTLLPGQVLSNGTVLKAERDDARHVSVFRIGMPDGEPTLLAELAFPEDLGVRTLFTTTPAGNVLLATHTTPEQVDPEQPPTEKHVLVSIASNGKESYRFELPVGDGVVDVFRPVRRGDDGNVYVMKTSESGTEIVKVTP
jgi:hypothetical protein